MEIASFGEKYEVTAKVPTHRGTSIIRGGGPETAAVGRSALDPPAIAVFNYPKKDKIRPQKYLMTRLSKIEFFAPSRGRDVLFAVLPPPSMALVTAGFWPFICPDSVPKYARSEKIPAPAFRCLGGNLNVDMTVLHRQLPDLTNGAVKNGLGISFQAVNLHLGES